MHLVNNEYHVHAQCVFYEGGGNQTSTFLLLYQTKFYSQDFF